MPFYNKSKHSRQKQVLQQGFGWQFLHHLPKIAKSVSSTSSTPNQTKTNIIFQSCSKHFMFFFFFVLLFCSLLYFRKTIFGTKNPSPRCHPEKTQAARPTSRETARSPNSGWGRRDSPREGPPGSHEQQRSMRKQGFSRRP